MTNQRYKSCLATSQEKELTNKQRKKSGITATAISEFIKYFQIFHKFESLESRNNYSLSYLGKKKKNFPNTKG